jgi:hypothetical protein
VVYLLHRASIPSKCSLQVRIASVPDTAAPIPPSLLLAFASEPSLVAVILSISARIVVSLFFMSNYIYSYNTATVDM